MSVLAGHDVEVRTRMLSHKAGQKLTGNPDLGKTALNDGCRLRYFPVLEMIYIVYTTADQRDSLFSTPR